MDKLSFTKIEKACQEGLKPKMSSEFCREWKRTHKNCLGCPSEKDCKEFIMRFGQFVTQELIESGDLPRDSTWVETE